MNDNMGDDFTREEQENYSTQTLVDLLLEARATESEYLTAFELDYGFPTSFAYGAFNKLNELGIEHVLKDEDAEKTLVTLTGQGADQLESIIKFDGWFTLVRTLDVAAGLRIDVIEMQEKHPLTYWINAKMGRNYSVPSNKEIEEMVRADYEAFGITF